MDRSRAVFAATIDHLMLTDTIPSIPKPYRPRKMAAVILGSGCVGPGVGQDLVDFFLHEPKHQNNIDLEHFEHVLVLCQ